MVLANLKSNVDCCRENKKIIIIILKKFAERFGNTNRFCYICNVIEEMKSDDTDSNLKSNGDCCQKKIKKVSEKFGKTKYFCYICNVVL